MGLDKLITSTDALSYETMLRKVLRNFADYSNKKFQDSIFVFLNPYFL